ncbi:hypothetical protein T05_12812 [Trichinella murrelli]|uniref:Uncharacterized protein n=1 Tax=Trichinella murrelli TaxID=144512 RepID=A0A0V0TDH8_9BILA|nr:hypothetical protein T05_12812 [Trichinella murrelli]
MIEGFTEKTSLALSKHETKICFTYTEYIQHYKLTNITVEKQMVNKSLVQFKANIDLSRPDFPSDSAYFFAIENFPLGN